MSVTESITGRTADDATNVDALFEEARRRRRRRWLAGGLALVVLTVGAGVVASMTGGGLSGRAHRAPKAPVRPPAARTGSSTTVRSPATAFVTSVALPAGFSFSSVSASGDTLWLSGGVARPRGGSCTAAELETTTGNMKAQEVAQQPCTKPAFLGRAVTPVLDDTAPGGVIVRIATKAEGSATTGPIIMTASSAAGSHPEFVYGTDSLWIWGLTSLGPEIVQVSATTGEVQATSPLPAGMVTAPLMAADDDGLWLAGSVTGADSVPAPIYHVAPGSHAAVTVHQGGRAAAWLVAEGHDVWVDVLGPGNEQTLWKFSGPGATPRLDTSEHVPVSLGATGGESEGLWTVTFTKTDDDSCRQESVVRIDPDSGRPQVVATLHFPSTACGSLWFASAQATVADGSLYLLGPPVGTNDQWTSLYEVRA
jgi:hypothetical protein